MIVTHGLVIRHATGETERRILKDEVEFTSALHDEFGLNISDDEIRTCISIMERKGEKDRPIHSLPEFTRGVSAGDVKIPDHRAALSCDCRRDLRSLLYATGRNARQPSFTDCLGEPSYRSANAARSGASLPSRC